MTFAGWGGFNGRLDARAANNRTVARWSGNTSTAGTTPNRIGGAVPSMLQPTSADQPGIKTLTGGVQALEFDGTNSDLLLAPSAAVALLSPRLYWALHTRLSDPAPTLKTLWAEWGTTERLQIAFDATSVIVTVALSAVTTASATFPLALAARQAGVFLEVFYDGNAAVATNRIRLYVNQVEVTASAFVGTLPTTLLLGNAVANYLGSLNGLSNILMQVAHFWFVQGHPTTVERAALALDEAPDWTFTPTDLSVANGGPVSTWLQVPSATVTGSGVSSLPDALNANPAVQATDARRPPLGASANGLAVLTFDGTRNLGWPVIAANNGATAWGWAGWVKFGSLTATSRHLLTYWNPATSGYKLNIYQFGQTLLCRVFIATGAVDSRQGQTAAVIVSPRAFLTVEWDSLAATEALRMTITLNGLVLPLTFTTPSGVPGTITTLHAPTGTAIIGDVTATPTLPFLGDMGPQLYTFNAKMAGASVGLLTRQARFDLMNYQRPLEVPETLSVANGGPVSSWLRVAAATITGLGVSSLPDVMNTSPAVQATDAKRPARGTSANGLPILTPDGGDMLQWPLTAANNGRDAFGFGFWFKPANITATAILLGALALGVSGGSSVDKLQFVQGGAILSANLFFSNGNYRQSGSGNVLTAGVWVFVTLEYYAPEPTESLRQVITVNASPVALTFANGGAGGSGALSNPTGNVIIGAQSAGSNPLYLPNGSAFGPNIYAFNARMPGATAGLLTTAARTALMNFEAPT